MEMPVNVVAPAAASIRSETTAIEQEIGDRQQLYKLDTNKLAKENHSDEARRSRQYSSSASTVGNGGGAAGSCHSGGDQAKTELEIVSWEDDDAENPYNWSFKRKGFIVFTGIVTVINSTLGSSLPSNGIPYIAEDFGITVEQQTILPISVFLIGYIFGPLLFAPISEEHGRRRVTQVAFAVYSVSLVACALAPSFAALLVFRLISGVAASAPIVVTAGLYADLYSNPITRGRAMALFMTATVWGPFFSPIISGYVSVVPSLGWRWSFWIGLMFAGVSWVPVLMLPETYGPVLLSGRAHKLRKENGNPNVVSRHEIASAQKTWKDTVTKLLLRPVRMLFLEPIVLSTSLYLSLAYAIFYMYFEAYPIIFQELYGLSPGESGLMFLPIGAGAVMAIFIFLGYEQYYLRSTAEDKPWTRREEASRVPLAFIGGPLYVVALFWLGWTARDGIPFFVPMLAGVPFGMGFLLIFMALLNYLTDAYEIYAASALAATSMCRSVFGAVLPLATGRMYRVLGIGWASSLLGFASLLLSVIPFLFFIWGDKIRSRSKFCQELKRAKEDEERQEEMTRRDSGSAKEAV